MNNSITKLTDANFDEEVLKSTQPVLVDYWAEWCAPCHEIAHTLDTIAEEYTERLKVAKLNIDQNPQISSQYNVRGIPTLMLFKNGSHKDTSVGALTKSQLTAFVDKNI